jgi:hypothetical protein
MPDKFDLFQTALAFSFAAGRAENIWGDKAAITGFFDKALKSGGPCNVIRSATTPRPDAVPSPLQVTGFLSAVGPKLLGEGWEIVWGPCVFADPTRTLSPNRTCLANGMFVAYSHSANTYVVAISPTNFASSYAFKMLDLDNAPDSAVNFPVDLSGAVVPRDGNNPGTMQLTGGTGLGVFNLCKMRDPRHDADIATYLAGATKDPATNLIFAGHSLGGALAPSLALQLHERLTRANWTPHRILVLATAGATPGNQKFAGEWAAKFHEMRVGAVNPENRLAHFGTLHWNRLDAVPHAFTNLHGPGEDDWNKATRDDQVDCPLGTCTDLANIPENLLTKGLQSNARTCDLSKLRDSPFTGRWPVNYWTDEGKKATYQQPRSPLSYDDLTAAKPRAHMDQYLDFAGIDPWEISPPLVSPD